MNRPMSSRNSKRRLCLIPRSCRDFTMIFGVLKKLQLKKYKLFLKMVNIFIQI